MGEFAGAVRRDGDAIDSRLVDRIVASVGGIGRPRLWRDGVAAVVHRALRDSERGATADLPVETASGLIVAADARLDEPDEIARALGVAAGPRRSSAMLVAAACDAWRAQAAERLNGSFAFAVWDEVRRELTLARDGLGTRALYYVEHGPHVFFATTLQSLLSLPDVSREIDDLVLAQYLTIENQDTQRTLYRHIKRVPPGGTVTVRGYEMRVARYWTLDHIADVRLPRDADYVEAARALFDRAVACRLPSGGTVATTVSGGFDSAGVTATVARLLGDRRFPAFHRAPGGTHPYDALDETPLVEAIAALYPNIDLTIIRDDCGGIPTIDAERDAAEFAVPRMVSVNALWFQLVVDHVAAAGVDLLLGGGCGNITLSWEGRPSIAADVRAGRLAGAWQAARNSAAAQRRPLGRVLAAQLVRPFMPRAVLRARQRWQLGGRLPWADYSVVSEQFLHALAYDRHAREHEHDLPFDESTRTSVRQQRLRALQGQVVHDLAGGGRRRGGVPGLDPYADRRLVEFTLGTPNDQFWRDGQDRWLARRVLADRLPAELLAETRRGLQCPEWYEVLTPRRDEMAEAIDRIERSPLAARVVDVARMRRLLDTWPTDAESARGSKQLYAHALSRGIAMGGFLRQYERNNG